MEPPLPEIKEIPITRASISRLEISRHDKAKVKGGDIFSEPYCNVYLVARKKSGKTWVVGTILNKCAGKNTTVYLFVSTHSKDAAWVEIKKKLAAKGIEVIAYDAIREGKVNHLDTIIKELNEQHEDEDEDAQEKKIASRSAGGVPSIFSSVINAQPPIASSQVIAAPVQRAAAAGDSEEEEAVAKGHKPSKITPEVMFVFDDISSELKNPVLISLLKKNRHYKSKIIISSQDLKDLSPASRFNIDYWILFPGLTEERLKTIYSNADVSVDELTFSRMYGMATAKKFNFLFVDRPNDQFRHNFNKLLVPVRGR